jgi:hypothetical protein
MTRGEKVALYGGGGLVVGLVVLALFEHKANAAPQPAGCKCPDGTPCPNGDVTQCPALGGSLGPSNQSGQTYNYTGQATSNVQAAAQALAAVDPCQCANVALVRAFQRAAGLTVNGMTDGRYGSNTAAVLAQYVPNAPAACSVQSWQGAEGTYDNPNCPGDPGPNA